MYKLKDFTDNRVLLIREKYVLSITYVENTWNGHDVLNATIAITIGNREIITVSNTNENKKIFEYMLN